MQYKILKCDRKTTSTGKAKIDSNLEDVNGIITENVGIWSDFANFANLKVGDSVMGDIKVNGQWKSLVMSQTTQGGANRGQSVAYRTKLIDDTMKKKEASISHFQSTKEESIKISSTMRDAVLLAIAEGKPTQENIQKWRKWLWFEWEAPEKYIPFISNPKELEVDDYPENDAGIPF